MDASCHNHSSFSLNLFLVIYTQVWQGCLTIRDWTDPICWKCGIPGAEDSAMANLLSEGSFFVHAD